MIKARIVGTIKNEITDYLGGDEVERGEKRTVVWPGVEVHYIDGKDVVASANYYMRQGSAIQDMTDIEERIKVEVDRLNQERVKDERKVVSKRIPVELIESVGREFK